MNTPRAIRAQMELIIFYHGLVTTLEEYGKELLHEHFSFVTTGVKDSYSTHLLYYLLKFWLLSQASHHQHVTNINKDRKSKDASLVC